MGEKAEFRTTPLRPPDIEGNKGGRKERGKKKRLASSPVLGGSFLANAWRVQWLSKKEGKGIRRKKKKDGGSKTCNVGPAESLWGISGWARPRKKKKLTQRSRPVSLTRQKKKGTRTTTRPVSLMALRIFSDQVTLKGGEERKKRGKKKKHAPARTMNLAALLLHGVGACRHKVTKKKKKKRTLDVQRTSHACLRPPPVRSRQQKGGKKKKKKNSFMPRLWGGR